jgi:hypothetical protein
MSINRKIVVFCLWGVLLTACQAVKIPKPYDFKPSEVKGNPYGCWIDVVLDSSLTANDMVKYSGELICVDSDSLFLLDQSSVLRVFSLGNIRYAELYTHANQALQYRNLTLAFLIPNLLGAVAYAAEYGGAFLAMGLPVALVGVTQILVEGNLNRSILRYPEKNSMDKIKMYSRFPAGKPQGVDFSQLTLKVFSF